MTELQLPTIISESLKASGKDINLNHLVDAIGEFQKRSAVWGHGEPTKEKAESILEEGLFTDWSTLNDIAYKLPEHQSILAHRFLSWDYYSYNYIILISAPKDLLTDNSQRQQSIEANKVIFEAARPPAKLSLPSDWNKRISTRRLIGYVDRNSFELIKNPAFKLNTE